MKLKFLTYADHYYKERQDKLIERAISLGGFDEVVSKTRADITDSEEEENIQFYQVNQVILDEPRGSGFWLWKPFFILQELKKMEDGDVLMYIDSGDWLSLSPRVFLDKKMQITDILLTDGSCKNSDYCKRDCFKIMNCDTYEYHNVIQLEAGIIVVKKSDIGIKFIESWLDWCKVAACITNYENTLGPNLLGFIDHRNDQSILTNLKVSNKLYSSREIRQFVVCNYTHPEN